MLPDGVRSSALQSQTLGLSSTLMQLNDAILWRAACGFVVFRFLRLFLFPVITPEIVQICRVVTCWCGPQEILHRNLLTPGCSLAEEAFLAGRAEAI